MAAPPSHEHPGGGLSAAPAASSSRDRPRGPLAGLRAFLRRHPFVCLALLTPGIPEYLSSSSPLNAVVLNPAQFAFQLVANLGLYLPGVLLVREARVRWRAGWTTVLLLGAAYGLLEEGVALSTVFDPRASVVGSLGSYGHWVGVNWVWLPGVLLVHMVLSISVPILLFETALPELRERRFLTRPWLAGVVAVLTIDVVGLALLVRFGLRFWMGWPQLAGALGAIAVLVYLGRRLASWRLPAPSGPARGPVVAYFGLGIAFFPGILFPEALLGAVHATPVAAIAAVVTAELAIGALLLRASRSEFDQRRLVAFVAGILAPIMLVGVLAEIALPFTLAGDLAAVLFLRALWRRGPVVDTPSPQPAGA